MLSLSHPKPTTSFFPTHHHHHPRPFLVSKKGRSHYRPLSVSASGRLPFSPPPPSPPGETYQPFRPPPSSPLPPQYRSLPPTDLLAILRDRLGLWHDYAPLISSLSRQGFTPSSIEESTGLSGVEQNRLVVAAQVRDSLNSPSFPPDHVAYFDAGGGAELLYELRLLSAAQRSAAAALVIDRHLDPRGAQELARAMKNFPRRRGEHGWDSFDAASPGDCLAYIHFRLSREVIVDAERDAALDRAFEAAETESAKNRILAEIEKAKGKGKEDDEEEEMETKVAVEVVRLRYGEVAEAASVALVPVVKAAEGATGMVSAPSRCRSEGELGIVAAEKGWMRWAVLPGWAPVLAAEEAVGVEMEDGRGLPWRILAAAEEAVMVVADRKEREVTEEGGAYVVEREGRLVVERGRKLMEMEVKEALGRVVVVVRPPKEEDDQLTDDWE
ncbi:LOW QUALITY PROTEIN: rubisco accumulation factor 1, chloroplastic-like [Typha latifolia]|uniref:LOW QUALITY PROTEIN: rubisco accumulation factor 1, chloroplastic-like n=1 Tax=Typha latifolia TaxID=4733 RepID=UPI003C303294